MVREDIHNAFLHKTLLEIKQMEQVEIHDSRRWEKQELISHMLLYVVKGKGKLYMNDGCNAAELLPNTVFLLPVGSVLAAECAAEVSIIMQGQPLYNGYGSFPLSVLST